MDSWANSGSRDLHLDLRQTITPGARGARDLLLSALRDAVRSGRLAPGTMLPPSRSLATDLGLARNTVSDAYAELVAEGWLASRQGAGTWVVNVSGTGIPARPRGVRVVPTHNLMPGSPDVAEFPRNAWVAATRRALANAPTEALRMGDPRGRPELRDALAEYLARARGVRTSPESIVICAGVRHAVELLTRVVGGPIALEAYGLFIFRDAIAALGVQTIPIGLDENGAMVSDLDELDVPAVLLAPAHATTRRACRCTRRGAPPSSTGPSGRVQLVEITYHRAVFVEADRDRRHAHRCDRVAKDEQPVGLDGDRSADEHRASSSTACRTPAQITIDSGDVRTPRARPRYSASASRSSGRPRGSPMRSASVGASASARRVEASHALRGNSATSGEPGIRLCVGTTAHAAGAAGMRVAAGVDDPGARALARRQPALGDEFGVGLGDRVAGQSEVGGQAAGRRQHRAGRQAARPHGVAQGAEQQFPGSAGARRDGLPQVQVQITASRIGP